MKITDIKQQVKNRDRVSVFVDGRYAFSLSLAQWQDSGARVGDSVSEQQLADYKKISVLGKLFDKALQYLARRRRSEHELRQYLGRKQVAPEEIDHIITRLYELAYLNDEDFARAWVQDRNLLKPSSQRKLRQELRQKGVSGEIIELVLSENETHETKNLRQVIQSKRRQQRYQDDTKLLLYLTRQGFSYQEAKAAIAQTEDSRESPL